MCETPVGVISRRIALADGATRTVLPLTFICTDALPSVSSSFGAVSVGTVCPVAKVRSLISLAPLPLTRHAYTVPVGTSSRVALVGTAAAVVVADRGSAR